MVTNTTATATVEAEQLVSDNGAQLVSRESETFLQKNGVKHISQHQMEQQRGWFKISNGSGRSLQHDVDNFVFVYRNTPHAATQKTHTLVTDEAQLLSRHAGHTGQEGGQGDRKAFTLLSGRASSPSQR